MFTCIKHCIVCLPQRLVKLNKSLHQLSDSLLWVVRQEFWAHWNFSFPKWLHVQETCVGVLITTSWPVFHAALLFWNPHSEQKHFTWVAVKFAVGRKFLAKNSNFRKVGTQHEEQKDYVDIHHTVHHLPLPRGWDFNRMTDKYAFFHSFWKYVELFCGLFCDFLVM